MLLITYDGFVIYTVSVHDSETVGQRAQDRLKQLNRHFRHCSFYYLHLFFSYCDMSKVCWEIWKVDLDILWLAVSFCTSLLIWSTAAVFCMLIPANLCITNASISGGWLEFTVGTRTAHTHRERNTWSWPQSKPMRMWHAWQELNVDVGGHCVALA